MRRPVTGNNKVRGAGECTALDSKLGKRAGGFLYVHRTALPLLSDDLRERVTDLACRVGAAAADWNVAKIGAEAISLLTYEDFDAVAFPALLASTRLSDAGEITRTDYSGRANPSILHRKETLLPPDDYRIPLFTALTRQAEDLGLFEDTKIIGTRQRWEQLIEAKGAILEGHTFRRRGERSASVERHRTAMVRRELSQPVAVMRRLGIIEGKTLVFDYGCGHGDDVAILLENGIQAFGWDPHHAPNGPRTEADVVNLGYVVNVIENPHERAETVRSAWGFARRCLTVSSMLEGKVPIVNLVPFGDGYLTSRSTFQRYFSQEDLRKLVKEATGEDSVTLAPGIVAAFRDKELEQEILYRKRAAGLQVFAPFVAASRPRPERRSPTVSRVMRTIPETFLDEIRRNVLMLGRLPGTDELRQDLLDELAGLGITLNQALTAYGQRFGSAEVERASEERRKDLVVHFALSLFPGAPRYASLPKSLQRDVKALFGGLRKVLDTSAALLASFGVPDTICSAVGKASEEGHGGLLDGVFRFRSDVLPRLSPELRVMVGCAELVHPDLGTFDFIEIDPADRSVTGIACEDATRPIPRVVETVQVNLGRHRIYRRRPPDTALYLKGMCMPTDDLGREAQLRIDEQMLQSGLVDRRGRGPSIAALSARLRQV